MKYLTQIIRADLFLPIMFLIITTTSCNKEVEQFSENVITPATGLKLLAEELQTNTDDSLYYRMVATAGLTGLLSDSSKHYTMFVTNNLGVKMFFSLLSGGALSPNDNDAYFSNYISTSDSSTIVKYRMLILYNTIPQDVRSADISSAFPNFVYPTAVNPSPTTNTLIGPVIRLATYPTSRNGGWLNNMPITGLDQLAFNGVIHHTATIVAPAQDSLWNRISTDPDLTYLKAAILRADVGVSADSTLQHYLSMFGPDFTIFAPVDNAFREALTLLITRGILAQGFVTDTTIAQGLASGLASTPAVFSNPLLSGTLTPKNVKGLLAYHILMNRAFTNNFPTTETAYPTLLNSGVPQHPGLKLKCIFGVVPGVPFPIVISATLKDVLNNTANLIINTQPFTPNPFGTSDQNFINGTLNKIDKVLLPQSF